MSRGKRAKMSTELGSKANCITPIEIRRRLAARISESIGISEEEALGRIKRFPSLVNNAEGVLFQKQKPFVDALLEAVKTLDPCYTAICDDIRSKIVYAKRKKIQSFSTWITMALAGEQVFLNNAYDGPGMYVLRKVGDEEAVEEECDAEEEEVQDDE